MFFYILFIIVVGGILGKVKSLETYFLISFFIVILAIPIIPNYARAHGGGLDAHGCHIRRATGEYHCHREQGRFTKNKIREKGERGLNYYRERATEGSRFFTPKISPQDGSCACVRKRVCIGPRGGHYCINGSGNKRYLRR